MQFSYVGGPAAERAAVVATGRMHGGAWKYKNTSLTSHERALCDCMEVLTRARRGVFDIPCSGSLVGVLDD